MNTKIDIRTHHYFPYYMIILGIVLSPLIVIPVYPILSVGVAAFSFMLVSTHYRLRIDPEQKTYRVYLWIFGIKSGKWEKLEHLKYLYINRLNREEEYGLVSRMSFSKEVYAAYIKLDDGSTLYIGERSKEKKMLIKAEKISSNLGIETRKNY